MSCTLCTSAGCWFDRIYCHKLLDRSSAEEALGAAMRALQATLSRPRDYYVPDQKQRDEWQPNLGHALSIVSRVCKAFTARAIEAPSAVCAPTVNPPRLNAVVERPSEVNYQLGHRRMFLYLTSLSIGVTSQSNRGLRA